MCKVKKDRRSRKKLVGEKNLRIGGIYNGREYNGNE